jgi:hypothetical protein
MDRRAQIGEGRAASCGTVTDDTQSGKDVRTYVNSESYPVVFRLLGRLQDQGGRPLLSRGA